MHIIEDDSNAEETRGGTDMVKMGVEYADHAVKMLDIDFADSADPRESGEIGTAAFFLRLFGEPEGLVKTDIGVLRRQNNGGLFICKLPGPPKAKYILISQKLHNIGTHGGKQLLDANDIGAGFHNKLAGKLFPIHPAVFSAEPGITL